MSPKIIALISEERSEQRRVLLGRTSALRDKALSRLYWMLESRDIAEARKAASLVLTIATKVDFMADVDQRVLAIERKLRGAGSGGATAGGRTDAA
jgi:hypothetical protein